MVDSKQHKPLFAQFLDSKRIYSLNRRYWAREICELLAETGLVVSTWYEGRFANGSLRYDGNPIYAGSVSTIKRAFRIIQEEPPADHTPPGSGAEWGAWVQVTERKEPSEKIDELVISLELTPYTKDIALRLLTLWLKDVVSKEEMEKAIQELSE